MGRGPAIRILMPVVALRGLWAGIFGAALLLAGPGAAQVDPVSPAGILTLDQEQLFAGSEFGQRAQAELERASQDLAAENREIEAALTAEELDLTERRDNLPREEFTELAEEFDARVEEIRAAQDAKARALTNAAELARQRFFDLAVPILLDLVRDRGGAVILDRRSVLLAAEGVDITDAAIAAVNAEIGAGGDGPLIVLDDTPVLPRIRPDPDAAEPGDDP